MEIWRRARAKSRRVRTVVLGSVLILGAGVIAGKPKPIVYAQNTAPSAQNTAPRVVSIDNFSFAPMEITVPAGTPIIWINKDDVPHTVVSVDHKFKSQALDTDEKFSLTLQSPGTYEYFCSVHPRMVGKIIVK